MIDFNINYGLKDFCLNTSVLNSVCPFLILDLSFQGNSSEIFFITFLTK